MPTRKGKDAIGHFYRWGSKGKNTILTQRMGFQSEGLGKKPISKEEPYTLERKINVCGIF